MTKFKIIGITILSIILAGCVGVISWWTYIDYFAPNKVTKTTYNIDLQTLSDGTQQPLIEVQIFRAKEGNGLPAYEIRYNTVTDENRSAFYSYGAQYIGQDLTHGWTGQVSNPGKVAHGSGFDKFQNSLTSQKAEILGTSKKHGSISKRQYYFLGLRQNFVNADTYYYQSGSDFYNSFGAEKLFADNEVITATVKTGNTGNAEEDYEIIGMRFKAFNGWEYHYLENWEEERDNPNNCIYTENLGQIIDLSSRYSYLGSDSFLVKQFGAEKELAYIHYYGCYDINFLATYLYDEIKDLQAGTNGYDIVKLGDYFDFSKYEDSSYKFDTIKKDDKVERLVQSYCSIKITIHDTGITKADQSLFKSVKGSAEFNLTNDYTEDNYFIGRTNVNVTAENFIFVNVIDNKYAVKLKQSFVDYYSKYEDLIVLSINLDLESLRNKNIEVVGYTEDSGLENFVIRTSNVPTSEVLYV